MRTARTKNSAADVHTGDVPPTEETGVGPGSAPHGTPAWVGDGQRDPSTGGRRWGWGAAIAAAAVALAAVLVVVLNDDDERSDTTTSTTPPASAPSSTAATDSGAPLPPTAAPTTAPPAGSVLEDGRHPVFLTGLDVTARSVEFDLIQFLTGDEATAAYHEDHPDDPEGPPNDYYIVNDNTRLRRLAVGENVEVVVVDGVQPQPIAFADLPDRLAGDLVPDDGRIWHNPFWLTVKGGTITAIEEQYIP